MVSIFSSSDNDRTIYMKDAFDLQASLERAERRLTPRKRRPRSDAGSSRFPRPVLEAVRKALAGQAYPNIPSLLSDLRNHCSERGLEAPSRASLYQLMKRDPGVPLNIADLPTHVRDALYNLDDAGEISGAHVVFYCFNQGSLQAIQYAAGMPWLCLYQARHLPGWRPRSRGMLEAVLLTRRRARGND